jgi:hypothetical protein
MRMRRLAQVAMIFAAVLALMGVQIAQAGSHITIDGSQLTGATAIWDVGNDYTYSSTGPCYGHNGYTPVEDGSYGSQSDSFDGGLFILVDGKTFNDKDGIGTKSHQQLTVGPTRMSGLKVTRVDTAFKSSPTLRSLVMLKNPKSTAVQLPILWDSGLGSDTGTLVQATSSGNKKFTLKDRWFVSADSNSSPSDPPVTMVMYGQGIVQKPSAVVNAPGGPAHGPLTADPTGCVTEKYVIDVPANSTRSLLFFTQMHDTNGHAKHAAKKFDSLGPTNNLFDGLSAKVRNTIVNWNL